MTDRQARARAELRGRLTALLAAAAGPLAVRELWEALGPLGGGKPSERAVQDALDHLVADGTARREAVTRRVRSIHGDRARPVSVYLPADPPPAPETETPP